jgi:hypothetical protein
MAWSVYAVGALKIALIVTGLDRVLGSLLTPVITNPVKPRRKLARDVDFIVCIQFVSTDGHPFFGR